MMNKRDEDIFMAGALSVTLAMAIIFGGVYALEYILGIDNLGGIKSCLLVFLGLCSLVMIFKIKNKVNKGEYNEL